MGAVILPRRAAAPGAAPDPGPRPQRYLHAGELAVAAEPTAIVTVLGSCVATCLYDPVAGVGGMNHFLLPHPVAREQSPRFGAVAVPALVEAVIAAGARPDRLRAKLFGGASVIGTGKPGRNLGLENAELATRILDDLGIPVLDGDVGGSRGRKLVFFTDQGCAWVRTL